MIGFIADLFIVAALLIVALMILETYQTPGRKGPQDGSGSTNGPEAIPEHGGET